MDARAEARRVGSLRSCRGVNSFLYVAQDPLSKLDSTGESAGKVGIAMVLFCIRFPRICKKIAKCAVKPKRCKKRLCALGNKVYKPMCNVPSCELSDGQTTKQFKKSAAQACLSLRRAVKKICIPKNRQDANHNKEIQKVKDKIKRCDECGA